MATSRKKIGELLVEAGAIDQLQLDSALGHQRQWGGRLGDVLVKRGFLREATIIEVLSKHLDIPMVRLAQTHVDPRALQLLPANVAEQLRVFPVSITGSDRNEELHVAMTDPTDLSTIDQLQFRTRKRIQPLLTSERDIESAIRRHYHDDESVPPPDYEQMPAVHSNSDDPFADVDLLGGDDSMVPGLVAWGEGEVARTPVVPQPPPGVDPAAPVPVAPQFVVQQAPGSPMAPVGIPPGFAGAPRRSGATLPPGTLPPGMQVTLPPGAPPPLPFPSPSSAHASSGSLNLAADLDPFAEMEPDYPDPLAGTDPSDPSNAWDDEALSDPLAGIASADAWADPPSVDGDSPFDDPLGLNGVDPLSDSDSPIGDAELEELAAVAANESNAHRGGPSSTWGEPAEPVDALAEGWLVPAEDADVEEVLDEEILEEEVAGDDVLMEASFDDGFSGEEGADGDWETPVEAPADLTPVAESGDTWATLAETESGDVESVDFSAVEEFAVEPAAPSEAPSGSWGAAESWGGEDAFGGAVDVEDEAADSTADPAVHADAWGVPAGDDEFVDDAAWETPAEGDALVVSEPSSDEGADFGSWETPVESEDTSASLSEWPAAGDEQTGDYEGRYASTEYESTEYESTEYESTEFASTQDAATPAGSLVDDWSAEEESPVAADPWVTSDGGDSDWNGELAPVEVSADADADVGPNVDAPLEPDREIETADIEEEADVFSFIEDDSVEDATTEEPAAEAPSDLSTPEWMAPPEPEPEPDLEAAFSDPSSDPTSDSSDDFETTFVEESVVASPDDSAAFAWASGDLEALADSAETGGVDGAEGSEAFAISPESSFESGDGPELDWSDFGNGEAEADVEAESGTESEAVEPADEVIESGVDFGLVDADTLTADPTVEVESFETTPFGGEAAEWAAGADFQDVPEDLASTDVTTAGDGEFADVAEPADDGWDAFAPVLPEEETPAVEQAGVAAAELSDVADVAEVTGAESERSGAFDVDTAAEAGAFVGAASMWAMGDEGPSASSEVMDSAAIETPTSEEAIAETPEDASESLADFDRATATGFAAETEETVETPGWEPVEGIDASPADGEAAGDGTAGDVTAGDEPAAIDGTIGETIEEAPAGAAATFDSSEDLDVVAGSTSSDRANTDADLVADGSEAHESADAVNTTDTRERSRAMDADAAWAALGISKPTESDAARVVGALVNLLVQRGVIEPAELKAAIAPSQELEDGFATANETVTNEGEGTEQA